MKTDLLAPKRDRVSPDSPEWRGLVSDQERKYGIEQLTRLLNDSARNELARLDSALEPEGRELSELLLRPLAGDGLLEAEDIQAGVSHLRQNPGTVDALMQNSVELLAGFSSQDLGSPIDWRRAPVGDFQWATHLSRHYWLAPLGFAWLTSRKAEYAAKIVDVLLDWIDRVPPEASWLDNVATPWAQRFVEPESRSSRKEGLFVGYVDGPWTSLSAHWRMDWWLRLLQLIGDAPVMTNRVVAKILGSLVDDHYPILRGYPRQMNQFQAIASSLIEFGLYLPQFSAASEGERVGWSRLEYYAGQEIYPDGSVAECSPNYGMNCVMRLFRVVKRARLKARNISALLEERIVLAARYYALTADPQQRSPRIAKGGQNIAEDLAELNSLTKDAEVAFVASGGRVGRMPVDRCFPFDWAGHYVFRSGWDPDAIWAFFDAGPRGNGHHDLAALSLQISARGQPVLVDPGFFSYSLSGSEGEMAAYLRSTAAHNAVLVNGSGQYGAPLGTSLSPNSQPSEGFWKTDEIGATATGFYQGGFGSSGDLQVQHSRKVSYRGNSFDIVDRLSGADVSVVDILWHLHPKFTPEVTKNGFAVCGDGVSLCLEMKTSFLIEIEHFKGSKFPMLGWYSESYGILEPCSTIRARIRAVSSLEVTSKITIFVDK